MRWTGKTPRAPSCPDARGRRFINTFETKEALEADRKLLEGEIGAKHGEAEKDENDENDETKTKNEY